MRARNLVWEAIWGSAKVVYGTRAMSPGLLARLEYIGRRLTWKTSPLVPPDSRIDLNTDHICHSEIRKALAAEPFDRWSVDVTCLNWLIRYVRFHRVRRVIETGSGLSTIMWAIACRENVEKEDSLPLVVSIEEDEAFASRTRALVGRHGLDDFSRVVCFGASAGDCGGESCKEYTWDRGALPWMASGWSADLVFIDGPTGGGLGRAKAAAAALEYGRKGCRIVMDDGLRHDEIRSMQHLADRGSVSFTGVVPRGKGLALGRRI